MTPQAATAAERDAPVGILHRQQPAPAPAVHLFVVPWSVAHPGGVGQVVINLYRRFALGQVFAPELLVLSWAHRKPLNVIEENRRVAYLRVRPPVATPRRGLALAKWMLRAPAEIAGLARFLHEHRVATINVHYPSLAALQFVFARALLRDRPRLVLSFHGLDVAQMRRATGLERRAWRRLLGRADAIVSCSNALRDGIVAFDPALDKRVTTIHNGLDIGHLMSIRNDAACIHPRLQNRRFILSVASFEPKKGLDTLLRAFKLVRQGPRKDVMLALIGADRGSGPELVQLAAQLGLSDHVVFCGPVDHSDVHPYYEAASVFCLPSRAEPFGIVLLEAGAFRRPVVATAVGGIPEILTDGVNGSLVPPDDPAALADRLGGVLDDPATGSRFGAALARRVETNFSWQRAYDAYLALGAATRTKVPS